jgi:hypothetical protein
MIKEAGIVIKDMGDRPSPDIVPSVLWKFIRL